MTTPHPLTTTDGDAIDARGFAVTVNGQRISMEIRSVDPHEATSLLAANTHNRAPRAPVVDAYAADMGAGDWSFNGDAIRIARDGSLLDGQHRLLAIVKSGAAVPCLIVKGLDPVSQEDMDGGVPRRFHDVLTLRNEANSPTLAAIVTLAHAWKDGRRRSLAHSTGYTKRQKSRTLEAHPELREYATSRTRNMAEKAGLPPSVFGFAWWLFAGIDAEDADAFFHRLASDEGHRKGEPIYELRRTLQANSQNARGERNRVWLIAVTIKAWNAYRNGETVGMYRWRPGGARPEQFPEPV